MLWLKRNLFMALGGLVALILLVVGSIYFFGARGKNHDVEEKIEEVQHRLDEYYNRKDPPFPSVTNIAAARREKKNLSEFSEKAAKMFVPVPYDKKVKGAEFKELLDITLYDLRRQAEQAGVGLPVKEYAFSFTAQKSKLNFAADTFPAVVEQLAEVKTLAGILIKSKINRLDGIKRARVCSDDSQSPTEYHQLRVLTNPATGAVCSPYEFSFQCFSAELASVMDSLVKSPHGFLVKTLVIETNAPPPATLGAPSPPPPTLPVAAPVVPTQPARPPAPGIRTPTGGPGFAVPPGSPPQHTGLATVLDERPFRVTMLIDVVKATK
jgi:hypothetical protein